MEGGYELVVSPKLLDELERLLLRPKFRKYLSEEEARDYVMYRQLKQACLRATHRQAACPCPPQGSSLDHRTELKGRMTPAHPDLELAGPGCHANEYYARR